ncbi:hypothetical protein RI367_008371 [Sorochytrium milnesiophthora]
MTSEQCPRYWIRRFPLLTLIALGLWRLSAAQKGPYTLTIGAIFPYALTVVQDMVTMIDVGMTIAVDEINNSSLVLPNTTIRLLRSNSWDPLLANDPSPTPGGYSVQAMYNLVNNDRVNMIFGDLFSKTTIFTAQVSSQLPMPQMAPFAGAIELADKRLTPYFSRLTPSADYLGDIMARYVIATGRWNHTIVLYTQDTFSQPMAARIQLTLVNSGKSVDLFQPVTVPSSTDTSDSAYSNVWAAIQASKTRIILLPAAPSDCMAIYCAAARAKLTGPGYFWISANSLLPTVLSDQNCSANIRGYHYIDYPAYQSSNPVLSSLQAKYQAQTGQLADDDTINKAYSGIHVIARGFEQFMGNNTHYTWPSLLNGTYNNQLLPSVFANTGFQGGGGLIQLNSTTGDLISDMSVFSTDYINGTAGIVQVATVYVDSVTFSVSGSSPPAQFLLSSGYANLTDLPPDRRAPDCPPGSQLVYTGNSSIPDPMQSTCAQCQAKSYNLDGKMCLPCPVGADCPGGTVVRAVKDYWVWLNGTSQQYIAYQCQVNGPCCQNDVCTLDNQCAANHTGVLCSQCVNGLFEWSGQCISCYDTTTSALLMSALLFVGFLGAVLFYAMPLFEGAYFKHLVVYYQLANMILEQSGVVNQFLLVTQLKLNLTIGQQCLLPLDPVMKEVAEGFIMPMVCMFDLLVAIGLASLCRRYKRKSKILQHAFRLLPKYIRESDFKGKTIGSVVSLGDICYLPLLNASVAMLSCRSVGGELYLTMVPAMKCWTPEHIAGTPPVAVLLLLLLVVYPAAQCWHIFHQRGKPEVRRSEKTLTWARALSMDFKDKYPYMSAFARVELAVLCILNVFFAYDVFEHQIAMIMVISLLMVPYIFMQPYREDVDNYGKIVSYLCVICLSGAALVKSSLELNGKVFPTTAIDTVLLIFPAMLVFRYFYDLRYNYPVAMEVANSIVQRTSSLAVSARASTSWLFESRSGGVASPELQSPQSGSIQSSPLKKGLQAYKMEGAPPPHKVQRKRTVSVNLPVQRS